MESFFSDYSALKPAAIQSESQQSLQRSKFSDSPRPRTYIIGDVTCTRANPDQCSANQDFPGEVLNIRKEILPKSKGLSTMKALTFYNINFGVVCHDSIDEQNV